MLTNNQIGVVVELLDNQLPEYNIQIGMVVQLLEDQLQATLSFLDLHWFLGDKRDRKQFHYFGPKAESMEIIDACCELTCLPYLLSNLNFPPKHAILFCVNKISLHIDDNHVFHKRTLHIKMDCYFIMDNIQDGLIVTRHLSSHSQFNDAFIKTLRKDDLFL